MDVSSLPVSCDVIDTTVSADGCTVSGRCAEQEHTVSCVGVGVSWTCECGGISIYIPGEVAGDEACRNALGYCPVPADWFECPYEPNLDTDGCLVQGVCSYRDVDAELRWVLQSGCSMQEGDWLCFCGAGAPEPFTYKLLATPDDGVEDVCAAAATLCTSRIPAPSTDVSECLVYDVLATAATCSFVSACYRDEVSAGDRRIAAEVAQTVRCNRDGSDWNCECGEGLGVGEAVGATFLTERSQLPAEASPCVEHFLSECGGVLE